jgi:hypothetical protein|tara:strand:- start:834 stop:2420 length:1587 start_codon:yes stop_codon:yes gene_type:complete
MKHLFKKIIYLMIFSCLIYSCSNDDFKEETTPALNINEVAVDNLEFNYENLSSQDKIKVIVGEAVSNFLINNPTFNDKLFSKLVNQQKKTTELLYIKEKNDMFSDGKSLENLLLEFYATNQDKKNLITNINTLLPNLVIKIPQWTEAVLGNNDLELEFAVYPCLTKYKERVVYYKNGKQNLANKSINNSNVVSEYLPIQVEESERLIPVEKNTSTTFWGDDFYEDNFPFLVSCTDFNRQTYTIHSNEIYHFVDKVALNEDLVNARLCAIQLPNNSNNMNCNIVYERDCRAEKNVIEGFKLTNLSNFNSINNQPGGEDVITFHFKFLVASMCGNLMQNEFCPPSDWTFVFSGTFFDFYEIQTHYGNPLQSESPDVIFYGNGYYLKAFPIYYDIPINLSEEGIYSQARYLPLTPNGTWDGNEYGSAISFAVYEHDDVTTDVSQTNSISVTNTTKVSAKLTLGEIFEAGGDFSNSVTRTSSTTYTIDAEKDVFLGKTAINYYQQNFTNPTIGFGYNVAAGSLTTHFAFYYE